jgi:hypothetical protein
MHSIEIDGTPADIVGLGERIGAIITAAAAFPVRKQHVRGLDHHLDRLVSHSRRSGDRQAQRESLEHAISTFIRSHDDLERLRVERFRPAGGDSERTLIMRSPPRPALAPELRLHSVVRKKVTVTEEPPVLGEVLLIDDDAIHGTTIGAIGFLSRGRVVWPDSSAAPTVERLLIHQELRAAGVACAVLPVRVEDVGLFESSFIVGEHGVSVVTGIDDATLSQDCGGMAHIRRAFDRIPWRAA